MDINATLIGQTIAMIVFVWFCMKYIWPPLMKALEERKKNIAEGLAAAERATKALFSGDIEGLSADEIADVFADVPSSELPRDELGGGGKPVIDLLVESGLASSRGDGRRSIEGGGVYVNNVRVESVDTAVTVEQMIEGRFLLLRKGKKSYHLVALLA